MPIAFLRCLGAAAMAALILSPAVYAQDKTLNLYIWSDYLAEDTLANF
ncbi:MAG: spermidine/putrescine ABC transporter substrate-binding protein PotF, partial [Rhodospirillaceae bacterium]|nr:spermidine/putrescine ABC transporter substrate-binding protein PotF [Rhodospirillaceae bacterium]